jgi:hypothetical protein
MNANRRIALITAVFGATLASAHADVTRDRASAAGYLRVMTRPDLSGGDSRLGFSNRYGRLLNEGPFASLQLRLSILEEEPGTNEPWTALYAKVEGGSIANTDQGGGRLDNHFLTQLYVQAGNVLLEDVVWQVGTLESYFGDLGLYDLRPAQIFFDTIGLFGRYRKGRFELLLGGGDAGFRIRGADYSTILTAGGTARIRINEHIEFGFGGQTYVEPEVEGNPLAPHATPDVDYADFVRGEVVEQFLADNPGMEDFFPNPFPTDSASYKLVAYLGFGKLGPLKWTNVFANLSKRHPDNFVVESVADRDFEIFVTDLTDERFESTLGTESYIEVLPKRFDLILGTLAGKNWNRDNDIAAGEDNLTFFSSVLRAQFYVVPTVHFLAETSAAYERSDNGNLYRNHVDSVFQSTGGIQDDRGLEFGDDDERVTWQGKFGWVLNPLGFGIYTRPSIRVLYGVQYSTQTDAFGNSFVQSLDENERFPSKERHWHQVLALEAEAWF